MTRCMHCSREMTAAEIYAHAAEAGPEICFRCQERENNIYKIDPPNPMIGWIYDRASQRHGSEGPHHDPYSYREYGWRVGRWSITIHAGLGEYISINGRTISVADRWARGPVDSAENRQHWRSGIEMLISMAFGWLFGELEAADAHWQAANPDPYDVPLSYYE